MSTSSGFFLGPHCFASLAKYHWVILDVLNDRYLCVDRRSIESLSPWLHGRCENAPARARSGNMPREAADLLNDLVSRGILSRDGNEGKEFKPVCVPRPTLTLHTKDPKTFFASQWVYAPAFFAACRTASQCLERLSLAEIVRAVGLRRTNRSPDTRFDIKKAEKLVAVFNALRLLYPRDYLCMFDALALLEFFFLHRLFPTWVFGVSAEPFKAHCWLQEGSVLMNDPVERVDIYSPIMCV